MSAAEDKGGVDEGDRRWKQEGWWRGRMADIQEEKMAENPEYAIGTSPRVGKQTEWVGRMGSVCRGREGGM